MLGGYQILDLTNINLELGADAVDITDSGVLKQLLNLREYIEKGYDFSRPLNNQLKPFQVRYRDKKADEEITATLWASLLVIESGFIISASIPNYANLEIFVTFSEETDDDGNNYWVINSAQVTYSLIASSGTKLYKHRLTIMGNDYDQNSVWFEMNMISSQNEELNSLEKIDFLKSVNFSNASDENEGVSIMIMFATKDETRIIFQYITSDVEYKDIQIIPTSITDTVTEL